jgi:hypothetical protein
MLQMQLDFAITSLFGKMGVAELEYKVASYKEGVIEIKDCSDPLKFWQALCLTSSNIDGSQ